MQNFKLNKTDLLGAQDWTFPTFTAYGPGRFKEIGNFCKNFNIQNVLIVTDSGSINLPFISDLQNLLLELHRLLLQQQNHEICRFLES